MQTGKPDYVGIAPGKLWRRRAKNNAPCMATPALTGNEFFIPASYLSPAPQAEPQAEATVPSFFFAHPNKLESAIITTSIFIFETFPVS